jgi:hypothetical protein
VDDFFEKDQSRYTSNHVETALLHRINTRFLTENALYKLKGVLAYRTIKVLPPFVIASYILARDLPQAGLLGESRDSGAARRLPDRGTRRGAVRPR